MEKLWLFGLFPGDKGDNTDTWMIKIMIKANQIDMDALLISKVDKRTPVGIMVCAVKSV